MQHIRSTIYFYAQAGLPVFPLCPPNHVGMTIRHIQTCQNPGKCPLIKDWQRAKAPTDEMIAGWIRKWPYFNIGLLLGSVSGLVGIDVDGEGGKAILNKWSNGDLPPTLMYSTPNQGIRYLYRIPENLNLRKKSITDNSHVHTECALLGDGCQTVLPPSIHQNGGRYTWIKN